MALKLSDLNNVLRHIRGEKLGCDYPSLLHGAAIRWTSRTAAPGFVGGGLFVSHPGSLIKQIKTFGCLEAGTIYT